MKKIGIVDVGSNTVRLCIYEISKKDKNYTVLLNTKEFTRLRNHVFDNVLSEEGIQKLFIVLTRYIKLIKKYDLDQFKIFATQTIRMVDNKNKILHRIKDRFKKKVVVLTSTEEALFGFNGMHQYLPDQKNGIFVDLGGGSTELVLFKDGIPLENHSFDFGSIVLRNKITHAIPTEDEIIELREFVMNEFKQLKWLTNISTPLVVGGGSSRNLVRIDKFITRRHEKTHGYKLGFRELHRTRKLLMLLTLDEIENIEGFTSSRADIIIPSIYVFECLYEYLKAPYFMCSRTGLREGVLQDMLGG